MGWRQGGRGGAHQEIGVAQDFCPRFLDYFGMGHFHHNVRVPGRWERGGEGLEVVLDLPLLPRFPESVEACHVSLWPGRGKRMEACPVSRLGERGPERVRALPESTQHLKEARIRVSESCSLMARSLTSPREQQGSGAGGNKNINSTQNITHDRMMDAQTLQMIQKKLGRDREAGLLLDSWLSVFPL